MAKRNGKLRMVIEFYSIVPLYDEEMKLKLNKGSNLLLDKFDQYGISDLIMIDRKNVAKNALVYSNRT